MDQKGDTDRKNDGDCHRHLDADIVADEVMALIVER